MRRTPVPLARGFSFATGCALIARMDPDLETVIRQALGIAKAAGKDDMGQAEVTGLLMESPPPGGRAAYIN